MAQAFDFQNLDKEYDQDATTAIDNVQRLGTQTNPDEEAEFQTLSRELGISLDQLRANPNQYRKQYELKKQKLEELKDYPKTQKFLGKEKNAAVASDDVEVLKQYEQMLKEEPEVSGLDVAQTLPAGALEGVGMGVKGAGELYGSLQRTLGRVTGATALDNWLAEKFPEGAKATGDVVRMFLDFENSLKWAGGNIKRTAKMLDLTDEERATLSYAQNVGIDITKGTGQVAGQILAYMANPYLGTAQLWGQGADQQAMAQELTGTKGRTQSADTGIIVGGAVTYVTEKFMIGEYLNRLPPQIKNRILRNLTDVMIAGGEEALQEVAENILQGVTEMYTTNPDAKLFDGMDREALAAGGTGIIVRSLINMMTPGRGTIDPSLTAAYKESTVRVGSEYDQERLDQRVYLAQQSKTNNRAGQAFKEFLEDVAPNEYVYMRPEALVDIEGLPKIVTAQIDGTGANVAMTMDMFLTEIVPDADKLSKIRPHVVMREDHLTMDEIKNRRISPDLQRMMDNARKDEAAMSEAEAVYEDVRTQLEGTLRQGTDTARMSAQLLPAMVVSQRAELAKMGKDVTVTQLYKDMGLKIVGPEAKINNNREVFSQDLLQEGDGKVGLRQDRIDFIIRENAFPDNKTEGFVAYVDPRQFIPATTPDETQRLMIGAETTELDQSRLAEEIQTPFLSVIFDEDTGGWRVDGHEGRHRLAALAQAGYNQVPIVLKTDSPVDPSELQGLEQLSGDIWNGVEAAPIDIYNPIPLTWDNKGKLSQEYGIGASPDILYQKNQDFGDVQITEMMEDEAGNQVRVTEKLQDMWDYNRKRMDVMEALRKCLKS